MNIDPVVIVVLVIAAVFAAVLLYQLYRGN